MAFDDTDTQKSRRAEGSTHLDNALRAELLQLLQKEAEELRQPVGKEQSKALEPQQPVKKEQAKTEEPRQPVEKEQGQAAEPQQPVEKERRKADGSTLRFQENGNLKTVQYQDKTSREFVWDGNELHSAKGRNGTWFDHQQVDGKYVNAWKERGTETPWPGQVIVNKQNGDFTIIAAIGNEAGQRIVYRTDDSKETNQKDGSRKVEFPNKAFMAFDKNGLATGMQGADGTVRSFVWTAKDGAQQLTAFTVTKPTGQKYQWELKKDGWYCDEQKQNKLEFSIDKQSCVYQYRDLDERTTDIHDPRTGAKSIAGLVEQDGSTTRIKTLNGERTYTQERDESGEEQLAIDKRTWEGHTQTWIRQKIDGTFSDDWACLETGETETRKNLKFDRATVNYTASDGLAVQLDAVERRENKAEGWLTESKDGHTSKMAFPDGTFQKFKWKEGQVDYFELHDPNAATSSAWTKIGTDKYKSGTIERNIAIEFDGLKYTVKDFDKKTTTTLLADGFKRVEYTDKQVIAEYKNDKVTSLTIAGVKLSQQPDKSWKTEDGKADVHNRQGAPLITSDGTVDFLTKQGTILRQEVGKEPKEITIIHDLTKRVVAENRLDDTQKLRFLQSFHAFQERTSISTAEKANTVAEIQKLYDSNANPPAAAFDKNDRAKLTEQLMWHVAFPNRDSQGGTPNCSVSDIRVCLERESPSKLAQLIREVSTTGKYTTAKGIRITLEAASLQATSREQTFPKDGTRSLLGKISDVTLANVYWQQTELDTKNQKVTKGSMRFEEVRPTGQDDPGTRLAKYTTQQDGRVERTEVEKEPFLQGGAIVDIYQQVTGKDESGRFLTHENRKQSKAVSVSTIEQLEARLERGPYPKIVQLQNDVLYGLKPDGKNHEHVVLVTGYDVKTKQLSIDNTHELADDLDEPDKYISSARLFEAMTAEAPKKEASKAQ